ncbi:MAG: aminoacyltransferase [Acidobacteria bacterium]|nr:aminoacyltransferase [Acidobacteriota bacterium]
MLLPLSETDRWKAWDTFLEATHETGFMQSSWWADFRATTGFEYFGVTLKDQGAVVGGAIVTKLSYASDRCFYYIQDGPVLPDEEPAASQVFEAILNAIEKRRQTEKETISHLRIEPRWQRLPSFVRGFQVPNFSDNFMEPRDTLCIDLRPAEQTILAQMKPKGRYNIRIAQRHNVSVTQGASEQDLTDFLRIYNRTAIRQGMGLKPPGYFRTLISMLLPLKQVELFFAEQQGRKLATALVIYFGSRATYFYGGSLAIRRRVMAPYLLHYEIMRRAKAMGYEWYDLWGIAPANEPDHPWQDISVFKHKFGGAELNLVPTLDYVYDSAAYHHYVATESDSELETVN